MNLIVKKHCLLAVLFRIEYLYPLKFNFIGLILKKLFRIATVPLSLNVLLTGQLRYLNEFFEVTAISTGGEELEEVERREGVKTKAIHMERPISPLKDLVSLYQLYRYFKKEKPDIVHSITPKAGLLSMIAARFAGVPVRMHTFTGLIFPYKTGIFKVILIWMDRILANSATHIFPEGQGVKDDLERYRITSKPLKIMANGNVNGIDSDYFNRNRVSTLQQESLKKVLGIEEGDLVFVFIGRLVRDKGINELVSAFKSLKEQSQHLVKKLIKNEHSPTGEVMPFELPVPSEISADNAANNGDSFYTGASVTGLDIRYRLGKIGYRGQHAASILEHSKIELDSYSQVTGFNSTLSHAEISQNNLSPKVKLLLVGPLEQNLHPVLSLTLTEIEKNPTIISTGYVNDVRPYLAVSDCLVLPSYREGFPNSVLQAAAMNLPCIVSDISGCNEIIENLVNGLIIPAKDEKSLAEAMKRFLDDDVLRTTLTNNSRDMVVDKYAHNKVWKAILGEYEQACE